MVLKIILFLAAWLKPGTYGVPPMPECIPIRMAINAYYHKEYRFGCLEDGMYWSTSQIDGYNHLIVVTEKQCNGVTVGEY
jgi:hypothetical protein